MSQAGTYRIGGGVTPPVLFLEGNDGIPVGPDAGGTIFLLGAHGINITNTAPNTETVAINNAITLGDLAVLPAGTNALTLQTGDFESIAGNIKMPNTNSTGTQGVYLMGGVQFMHNSSNDAVTAPNVFVGRNAGRIAAANGGELVGIGLNVFQSITASGSSVGIGSNAFSAAQAVSSSIGIGSRTLQSTVNSQDNTGVGHGVMGAVLSGSQNTVIGASSGTHFVSGNSNVMAGYNTGNAYVGAESNNILIGSYITGTVGENNTTRIGLFSGGVAPTRCFIAGIVGVTTSNSQLVTIDSTTGQLGVTDLQPFPWTVITLDQTAAVNNGYFANKAGTLLLALPATSAVGDVIEVYNLNTALGIQFTQAAGQQIFIGNTSTTLGAAGTLTSIAVGDALKIVCSSANQLWRVVSMVGNWTSA